jgi:hypothetical protein
VFDFANDYLEDVSFCVTDVLDAGTEGTLPFILHATDEEYSTCCYVSNTTHCFYPSLYG